LTGAVGYVPDSGTLRRDGGLPDVYQPFVGDFVRVRGRRWLVEGEQDLGSELSALCLACIDDDAQGETTDIVWQAELDATALGDEGWSALARSGTDDPTIFAAYLRTLCWNTATAADRDLFQAPFRAGIRLDAYQLLPLRKALRLPRVNLLIADDVGAGKTVEAGLVLRELLLRRRVNYVVVAAPAGMTRQWQDELEAKFGLAFVIVDRDHIATLRRERGFGANPWTAGSAFIVSHALLADETYSAGLRDALGPFRAKALLILDEAHHAAPASGSRYAVDSQFTRAVRDLGGRFEHRLFLSATPHNGHSNSFSSLLEMLDPQRFTRGVPVRPRDLDPVMVRRLKSDLRHFGERFPARAVEPIRLAGLPQDAPDLMLPRLLAAYGETVRARAAALPAHEAGLARLAFVGLQQRLLSSPAAFARTLDVHLKSLDRRTPPSAAVATTYTQGAAAAEDEPESEEAALATLAAEDDAAAGAAAVLAASASDRAQVERMLDIARQAAQRPDARVRWLADWVRTELASGGRWNARRLVVFTEYEDTRRWLERRLAELLDDLAPEHRIAAFTGATPLDRREELKRRFNADPAADPLRILLCTDAAREGINLQARCHDLLHFDLPWNPARLEQRNGRIDRKLQPALTVTCRYFLYDQRAEDVVLQALVRKTETIREELGSAGQVIGGRIADRLSREGIVTPEAQAREIDAEGAADPRRQTANEELDDATQRRRARQARELDDLRRVLEDSRKRVGVDTGELHDVVAVALTRAGAPLQPDPAGAVNGTVLYRLDPTLPAFAASGWPEALDTLRVRRRGRTERLKEWRAAAPIRALSFSPAITDEGADAEGVVQLHLEHRLVRRLLSRFLSQGFQSGLSRAAVVIGPGAQPRVVLLGRLALYGPAAARLHEEIIPVTAPWTEAERKTPLRPFATRGEDATLMQLDAALRDPRRPAQTVIDRVRPRAAADAADLESELRRRAADRRAEVVTELAARGAEEAASLRRLLTDQRDRIARAEAEPDEAQLSLFADDEAEQRRRDRQHWRRKLAVLDDDIIREPDRVRDGYAVRAERVEIVGLLYLWPATN
jgi:hypothetical protein